MKYRWMCIFLDFERQSIFKEAIEWVCKRVVWKDNECKIVLKHMTLTEENRNQTQLYHDIKQYCKKRMKIVQP